MNRTLERCLLCSSQVLQPQTIYVCGEIAVGTGEDGYIEERAAVPVFVCESCFQDLRSREKKISILKIIVIGSLILLLVPGIAGFYSPVLIVLAIVGLFAGLASRIIAWVPWSKLQESDLVDALEAQGIFVIALNLYTREGRLSLQTKLPSNTRPIDLPKIQDAQEESQQESV